MTAPATSQTAGAHCAPASSAATPSTVVEASDSAPSARLELTIAGMTCGHCVRAVIDALDALPSVELEHVRIGHASLRFEPWVLSPAAVIEALRAAGYQASFDPDTATGDSATIKAGLRQAPATGGGCCSAR